MRRIAIVVGMLLLALAGPVGVLAQAPAEARAQTPPLAQQIATFNEAQAKGDAAQSAALAAQLVKADLSATPFSIEERLQLRAALAGALADGGDRALAIRTLRKAIRDGERAAAASKDLEAKSALKLLVADLYERLGDFQLVEGDRRKATVSYTEAYRLQVEILGEEEPQTRFILEKRGRLLSLEIGTSASGLTVAYRSNAERLEKLRSTAAATDLSPLGPGTAASQPAFDTVRVFYGATRSSTTSEDPERAFGGGRGQLSLGSVVVTIPKERALGAIPRPGLFDLAGAKDGVHIVLKRVERDATAQAFSSRLQRSIGAAAPGRREAFVYVHGYNETFASAARRAAQLAIDLDIRGGAVMYSWPSGDALFAYQQGQTNVEPSVEGLVSLLRMASNSGAERIHLFAHSMGNRVLLLALDRLKRDGFSPAGPAFDQVIFASPDIDAETFVRQVGEVKSLARGLTLYASKHDRALAASSWLSGGYLRAGQTPLSQAVTRAVTSVDTSLMNRPDWIGHSDFAVGAINDVRAVVWLSLAPQARCPLQLRGGYWEAASARTGCDDVAFRRAISAIRLYGANAAADVEAFITQLEVSGDRTDLDSWRAALAIVKRLQN